MGRTLARIRSWLVGLARCLHRDEDPRLPSAEPTPYVAAFVEDEPEPLVTSRVYFVGGAEPAYASLACPCGCGTALRVNLRPEAEPYWTWDVQRDGAVTLSPSVWRKGGCRSHFFVRRGRVEWCRDDTPVALPAR